MEISSPEYVSRKIMEEISPAISPNIQSHKYSAGKWSQVSLAVPKEFNITVFVNRIELLTIMCSPTKLNCLVLGYLVSEGIIQDMKDIISMRVCEDDALADVTLKNADFKPPEKKVLTSGCGGGLSFNFNIPKIESPARISAERVLNLMGQLLENAAAYNLSGGIHTSAIGDGENILAIADDIGRHNTLDKLVGECLLRNIPTRDKILLTSGRVSSEMLRKAAVMQAPLVSSLTSPTEKAVLLARQSGITLIGYARGNHLTVYSHPDRLQPVR
jgi:FdhD protein